MADSDYYILTLAAIGRELNIRKQTSARVHLAAGLPLTWVSEQKDAFKNYLLQQESVNFTFRGVDYHIGFAGADIFPQGFSAVADRLREFKGVNMLCDIGNGTMNIMYINNGKPISNKCFTEKFGTHQCTLAVQEKLMQRFGTAVDDIVIESVLRRGTADISERYLAVIREGASEYAGGIMRRLREHEYDSELMRLYVVGGGSCLVKNFAQYDEKRVTINGDICATAKGYEWLANDPYLETREKEDTFLLRVQETIERSLQASAVGSISGLTALLQSVQPVATPTRADDAEDDLDTAIDFINSL